MSRYASNTTVASEQSRAEIERTLTRYGADQFMYGWHDNRAIVAFRANGRQVRFQLPLPDRNSKEFTHTPARKNMRSSAEQEKAYEQAVRQRWRALSLVIKAKLEAIEAGISVFQDEFLAHIVLPDGQNVGQWLAPQIESAYQDGQMPGLLPYYGGDK